MANVSPQESQLIIIEEGNISRQLLAEFGIRLDEQITNLLSRALTKFSTHTLTAEESHAILCAITSLMELKNTWKAEISKGDAAARKEFK